MKSTFSKYTRTAALLILLLITATGFSQNSTVEFTVNGLKVILRQTQKEETSSEIHGQQKQDLETKEFSSVEELLRHDAQKIVVPPGVAAKLNQSISGLPKPAETPWWRRFFSGQ